MHTDILIYLNEIKIRPLKQFQNAIKNGRNGGKLNAPNTHMHDRSLS